jgi:AcrR family transcriptional regulator
MPRSLDLEARERQVIEASWRVIVRDGVAALTVRNVAREAGLAPSSLRYVFPTQASVREKAIDAVLRQLRERVAAIPADSPDWAPKALEELLPLDGMRRMELEVALALGVAAMKEPALQLLYAQVDGEARSLCQQACTLLDLTEPTAAAELHALIDGLALHTILTPGDNGTGAQQTLHAYLRYRTTPPAPPTKEE